MAAKHDSRTCHVENPLVLKHEHMHDSVETDAPRPSSGCSVKAISSRRL